MVQFNEIVDKAGDLPIIIYFTATWCGPCQNIKPKFSKFSQEFQGKAIFIEVDVEERKDIAEQFGILTLPTFIA
jgi:thioredoxin-like negative regulator of GroEL